MLSHIYVYDIQDIPCIRTYIHTEYFPISFKYVSTLYLICILINKSTELKKKLYKYFIHNFIAQFERTQTMLCFYLTFYLFCSYGSLTNPFGIICRSEDFNVCVTNINPQHGIWSTCCNIAEYPICKDFKYSVNVSVAFLYIITMLNFLRQFGNWDMV